ncbi:MAG TPA: hypothetical protein VKB30_06280 [Candidatus Limnocylindrales bacterium]|nr:hypothetical protein [Candidatus Limnocylindrales bacterium]
MASDPLEQVLSLVAAGRLTADEAAPILAALDEPSGVGDTRTREAADPPGGFGPRPPGAARATAMSAAAAAAATDDGPRVPASSLRIEIHDAGRTVVNLRLPLAVGRFALDRVPGLSPAQVDRVREAMNSGFRGPVLVVDDDGDGVRISLE